MILLLLILAAEPLAPYRVESAVVVDGDTVRGNVRLPWRVSLRDETIRAADYDAWEASKKRQAVKVSDEEVAKGRVAAAAAALARLVADGDGLYVEATGDGRRDNYGRLLGVLWVSKGAQGWIKVSEFMTANKHTRK